MKITRVRVKTAVWAIVLRTTGSVMSTVKATVSTCVSTYMKDSLIVSICHFRIGPQNLRDKSDLGDYLVHACNIAALYKCGR